MFLYLLLFATAFIFVCCSQKTRYKFLRCCKAYGIRSRVLYQKDPDNVNSIDDQYLAVSCNDVFPETKRVELYETIEKFAAGNDDFEDFSDKGYMIQDIVDPTLNTPENGNWIASIYDTNSGKFKIPIHNGADLTESCSVIFKQMLPLFEQLLDAPLWRTKLKVYVKIKNIVVNQKSSGIPFGRLHQEGDKKENICAVGLYWIHIDKLINGGNLELSKKVANRTAQLIPKNNNKFYYQSIDVQEKFIKAIVPAKQNDMLVFDNELLYHQVQEITVADDKSSTWNIDISANRMVVAFFLVNPFESDNVLTVDKWRQDPSIDIKMARLVRNKFRDQCRKSLPPVASRYTHVDNRDFDEYGGICMRD